MVCPSLVGARHRPLRGVGQDHRRHAPLRLERGLRLRGSVVRLPRERAHGRGRAGWLGRAARGARRAAHSTVAANVLRARCCEQAAENPGWHYWYEQGR